MSFNANRFPKLSALEELARRSSVFISQVTAAAADAIAELTSAKADKEQGVYYTTCSTAGATQAKTVSIDGITALYTGLTLQIQFTNAQSYSGAPTLNVNSLGAKTIRRLSGTSAGQYEWQAGELVSLVYNGTYFILVDGGLASTTYYGRTKLSSSTSSTSTSMAATPSAVKAAYDLAAGKADKPTVVSASLPTTGWSSDSTADYPKYYDLSASGVTASDIANVSLAAGSIAAAAACGLCPTCETRSGAIRFRAAEVPAQAISISYYVLKGSV